MESSVYTTLKNTEKVCLQCHKLDDYNHYIIEAISTVGEKVAYTTFRIKEHNTCCLMKIEIINPSYAHQGLGTKMLIFMEYLASKQYCSKIDGKFYPFGDLGEFAREFYTKNGYRIIKEYYDTEIFKRIDNVNMEIKNTI